MKKHAHWLFLLVFGIAIIGCQDDITITNPENSSNKMGESGLGGNQVIHNLTNELGQVGDRIWKDMNKNGIQDAGEEGFPGVTVALYACDGTWLNIVMQTDIYGNYLFTDLQPGSYKVRINIPDGWLLSPLNAGNDDSADSDFGTDTYTECFDLSADEIDLTWDCGFYQVSVQPRSYGYWKTHSIYGPAPYDSTWAIIGENTSFFYSGQTWFEVIKTSPRKGNAYYILAHQYIAARLNKEAGSYIPINIATAIAEATALFNNPLYTPTYIENLKGNDPIRKEFLRLSGLMDNYNQGIFGPTDHVLD